MANIQTVNIDELTAIGESVKPGKHPSRLLTAIGKNSKKGFPMVEATFVVMEGPCEGLEQKIWYSLVVSTGKKGGSFAGGIVDMKRTFASIDKPLPAGFQFPAVRKDDASLDDSMKEQVAQTAAMLYGKRLKGVDVLLLVQNESERKDADGNVVKDSDGHPIFNTRAQVVGLAKHAPTVAAASEVAAFDFGDE